MLEFLQAITGVFVLVYDGQHGLRYTLGHADAVVGPGVHWKWPIFQKFRVENTKHTTLDLEPQVIQLADDLVYEVDCKLVYEIVDLRKALVEIDDLVMGLKNRVVIAVQHVVRSRDRKSVRDAQTLIEEVLRELVPVEEQWGVRILLFGFSNISPSPTTLEITQLELLARERLNLYEHLRDNGLSDEAAVALIAGAVVAMPTDRTPQTRSGLRAEEARIQREVEQAAKDATAQEKLNPKLEPPEPPTPPGE